ncbi:MAG: hypothetical protein AAF770_00320 [Bacteroidota bacterium]
MNKHTLEEMKAKALKQLRQGISLFGKNGAFALLLKDFLKQALEDEIEEHLNETQRVAGNNRSGQGAKTIKNELGTFRMQTP